MGTVPKAVMATGPAPPYFASPLDEKVRMVIHPADQPRDGRPVHGRKLLSFAPHLVSQVEHVLELVQAPALVAGHGDGVGILLVRDVHHILHAAVVPQSLPRP